MKDKLFQLFFCIYIFWNTVISTYLGMKGMEMDGSLMRLCLVIISGISLIFYAIYPQRSHEDKQMLGLLVLRYTDMPAVLVETAFIDNDDDALLLVQHWDDIARAIARGVTDYVQSVF